MTDTPRTTGDVAAPDEQDERGLYAVLGLKPSASDAEIQVAYRREAARLAGSDSPRSPRMRRLNAAYAVLGHPDRRAEYDRERLAPRPVMSDEPRRVPAEIEPYLGDPRNRSRSRSHKGRSFGLGDNFADLVALLLVVGLAGLAALFVLRSVSFNLSGLGPLASAAGLASPARTPAPGAAQPTAVPTSSLPIPSSVLHLVAGASGANASPVPTATVADFAGTTATPQTVNPARFGTESIVVKVQRAGQPAPNTEVWLSVQYRTTQERWPATGTVRTDNNGTATISLDVGDATAGYQASVQVYVVSDGNDLPVAHTSFTPQ